MDWQTFDELINKKICPAMGSLCSRSYTQIAHRAAMLATLKQKALLIRQHDGELNKISTCCFLLMADRRGIVIHRG